MQIEILDHQKDLSIDLKSAKKILRFLLIELGIECEEVSFYLVDIATISSLHDDFFNDPTPTDCITFPIDQPGCCKDYRILGEVFVCPKVAIDYAHDHSLDEYEEVCLYLIHGLLHLIGFDDIEEKDRIEMRKKEKWCMNRLREKKIKLKPRALI